MPAFPDPIAQNARKVSSLTRNNAHKKQANKRRSSSGTGTLDISRGQHFPEIEAVDEEEQGDSWDAIWKRGITNIVEIAPWKSSPEEFTVSRSYFYNIL